MDRPRVLIRGAGDMATAVAHRLHGAGFLVAMTEVQSPLAVRRAVAFSETIYASEQTVERVTARQVQDTGGILRCWQEGLVPVLVDPDLTLLDRMAFHALVEATLSKRKTDLVSPDRANVVIALGPGWTAPEDVHMVIETNRGHDLGRIIARGSAEPDTGIPGEVMGFSHERVLRAPCDGTMETLLGIGDSVAQGECVARVEAHEIRTAISGVVRGLLRSGTSVTRGLKIGDIDPRGRKRYCFTISDKARAVAGGVLEALLRSSGLVVLHGPRDPIKSEVKERE